MTQYQWLLTLPQDISFLAIKNAKPHITRMEASSLLEALCGAFKWSSTPQGQEYWSDIAYKR